jgi:small subunit ribosomal protein S8e
MTRWKTKRKGVQPSGAKYWPYRKKRLSEIGSDPTLTKVGNLSKKGRRARGGTKMTRLITTDTCNLNINGKFKKSKIKTVKENPANRHFVRMNVLTKGSVVETEDGLARITSRPGKDGVVNAVLIK